MRRPHLLANTDTCFQLCGFPCRSFSVQFSIESSTIVFLEPFSSNVSLSLTLTSMIQIHWMDYSGRAELKQLVQPPRREPRFLTDSEKRGWHQCLTYGLQLLHYLKLRLCEDRRVVENALSECRSSGHVIRCTGPKFLQDALEID